MAIDDSTLARFWAHVVKTDTCWLWTGPRLPGGYGRLGSRYAHRLSYELANGPIPTGLFVCHRCDVRACVNPDHLFVGTQADNVRDCVAKSRQADPARTRHVGESNGRAKLTERDVVQIRKEYAELPRKIRVRRGSLAEMAKRYGVTTEMIGLIVRGDNWREIREVTR